MNRTTNQKSPSFILISIYNEKKWDDSINQEEPLSYSDFERILLDKMEISISDEECLKLWNKLTDWGYFSKNSSDGTLVLANLHNIRGKLEGHGFQLKSNTDEEKEEKKNLGIWNRIKNRILKRGSKTLDPKTVEEKRKALNPRTWQDEKIDAYRESLRRHHDKSLETMHHMKNISLGMISALILALTIICAYALPNAENLDAGNAYDILFMSMSSFVLSLLFFMVVFFNTHRPTIVFNLDTPICGIDETKNIGAIDNFREFNITMLKYEVHEYSSQLKINRFKKIVMALGQTFALIGVMMLVGSMTLLYAPTENSSISRLMMHFSQKYASFITPTALIAIIIVVGIAITIISKLNAISMIKDITKSEREKHKKSSGCQLSDEDPYAEAKECIKESKKWWKRLFEI